MLHGMDVLMKDSGPDSTEVSKRNHILSSLQNQRLVVSWCLKQKQLRESTACKCTQGIFPFPEKLNMEKVAVGNGLMNHKLDLDTSTERTNED